MMSRATEKLPLSVFIITRDEEDRLPYTLNSIRDWVDEIIVVDSGSTDNTVELAQKLGATKVVFNTWPGYGQQKRFAESLCTHNWVMNLDGDEEVSTTLKASIHAIFDKSPDQRATAYALPVKFCPRFSTITEDSHAPTIDVIRFYDKTRASFKDNAIHDSVIVPDQRIEKLAGCLIHRCFRSFTHALEKINGYTSMQADEMFLRNKNPPLIRILIEPFWTFIKSYFGKKYYQLGTEGVLMAMLYAIQRTLRLMKIKEKFLEHTKN